MVSLTRWTWVWASFRSWWWTGKPGVLQSMGLQGVGHNWATERNWYICMCVCGGVCVYIHIPSLLDILSTHPSHLWGKTKLTKMACSGSLTLCFVNNDYVTAESICSTAHMHHEVLVGHGLCAVRMCEFHLKCGGITSASQLCLLGQPWEERIVCLLLWLLRQPGERLCCVRFCYGCCCGCCISQERINVCAVPTAPRVSFQPLGCALPTLGSGNSVDNVNSETFGVMNRISKTTSI